MHDSRRLAPVHRVAPLLAGLAAALALACNGGDEAMGQPAVLTPRTASEVPAESAQDRSAAGTPHPGASASSDADEGRHPVNAGDQAPPETPTSAVSHAAERYLRALCAADAELQREIRWYAARRETLGLDTDGPEAFADILGQSLWSFALAMRGIRPPDDIVERHAFAQVRYEALADRAPYLDEGERSKGSIGLIHEVLELAEDAPVLAAETLARLGRIAGGLPECADSIILPSFLGRRTAATGDQVSPLPNAPARPQPSRPPCEHIDPSPGAIEFEGDFSPEQRVRYAAEIRREYESVACFFSTHFGLVAPPLTIRLAASDAPGARGFAYGGGVIHLQQDRRPTTVTEVRGGTVTMEPDELGFVRVIAHEYVHALQFQIDNADWAPLWIQEGAAWYLDALHDRVSGRHDYFKSRPYLWWIARDWSGSLRSMEQLDWHAGVGFLAVERLVERAGEESLFDFYRQLANDPDWKSAFEATFGLAVDEFYRDFESWRAEAVPPWAFFSGVVSGPDGNPVRGVRVSAFRSLPGSLVSATDAWIVPVGVSQDDGTFRTIAEPGLTVLVVATEACGEVAFVDSEGGLTRDPDAAHQHVIELEGVSGIEVRLPRTPETLCAPEDADSWDPIDAMGWRR